MKAKKKELVKKKPLDKGRADRAVPENVGDIKAAPEEIKVIEKDIEAEQGIEESESKSTRYLMVLLTVIGVFIFTLIIFSRLIPEPSDVEESYTYNYFLFEKRYDTWFTETQEGNNLFEIALRYGPKELADVIVQGDIQTFRRFAEVYVTFDPTEDSFGDVTMANAEISTKLAMHFGVAPLAACTRNASACETAGAAIITCDTPTDRGILFLSQEPGAKVIIDGNCAIIQGEGEDIIRAADRFMLGYYGIMN